MIPPVETLGNKPIVWTIAASDSSGGAGIQADVKTLFDLGVYGCSVVTAITAQNSQGVSSIDEVTPSLLREQLCALAEDLPPVVVKIGVLPTSKSIEIVIESLQKLNDCQVVLDTVLAPSNGQKFANDATQKALGQLLPYVDIVTPNIPEAECLTGLAIHDTRTQRQAAEAFIAMGAGSVLVKGGHGSGNFCQDFFLSKTQAFWLTQKKQQTPHTHGTGCTLSSAIAAFIAHKKMPRDAVVLANAYVNKGIRLATPLGKAGDKQGAVVQSGWPNSLDDFPQVSASPEAFEFEPMSACESWSLGLYPVVDSVEWLQKLLPLGVKTIQLRIKGLSQEDADSVVQQAAELGRQYCAQLFINDYWQLAIKYKAYGVHLGQEDIVSADIDRIRHSGVRLGISTHGEYEFSVAATLKPSYLAIGAIFPTDTKEVIEVGVDNLKHWVKILNQHYPLVAIGGIHHGNIQHVLQSGVGSIAVVSAITKADDYKQSVKQLMDSIKGVNERALLCK